MSCCRDIDMLGAKTTTAADDDTGSRVTNQLAVGGLVEALNQNSLAGDHVAESRRQRCSIVCLPSDGYLTMDIWFRMKLRVRLLAE